MTWAVDTIADWELWFLWAQAPAAIRPEGFTRALRDASIKEALTIRRFEGRES